MPCLEEMPVLNGWNKVLRQDGLTGIVFLSADEKAETVTTFRKSHAEIPESLHIQNADALREWIEGLGLDKGAGLPVHVFIDPSNHVRCVRSGAIHKSALPTIEKLLGH